MDKPTNDDALEGAEIAATEPARDQLVPVMLGAVIFTPTTSDVGDLNVYPAPASSPLTRPGRAAFEQETRRPDGALARAPSQFQLAAELVVGTPDQVAEQFRQKLCAAYDMYMAQPRSRPEGKSQEQWDAFQRSARRALRGSSELVLRVPLGQPADS